MKGIVFDIQNYALYDGPGIRTCVFLKGCPLRCRWCHNPESVRPEPEMAYARNRCEGCGRCVKACPHNALSQTNRRKPSTIVRDRGRCKACGQCVEVCTGGAMELVGRRMTADEIVEQAAADRPFFDNSGGGVTLTGGEPTFQKAFLFELLKKLRGAKIRTAVETCGHFPRMMASDLSEAADLVLFDLKHLDPVLHARSTGADNSLILENFGTLVDRAGCEGLTVRIPVIPGFNENDAAMEALASYLQAVRYEGKVELMAYHGWAGTKYERIGRAESFSHRGEIDRGNQERIARIFTRRGFVAEWSGQGRRNPARKESTK